MKAALPMAHDVFISHSHADKPAADAACAALEARGIDAGSHPATSSRGRIGQLRLSGRSGNPDIVLLIFSRHANQSPQVQREVERAANSGKVLLPLRIDDVLPEETLEFFLSTPHWLDAITPPLEAHLEKLAEACSSILNVTGRSPNDDAGDPVRVAAAQVNEQPSARESATEQASTVTAPRDLHGKSPSQPPNTFASAATQHRPRRGVKWTLVALGIILILVGLVLPSLVPTFAFAHVLLVLGVMLLVVGLVLMAMGRMGRAVGGRSNADG